MTSRGAVSLVSTRHGDPRGAGCARPPRASAVPRARVRATAVATLWLALGSAAGCTASDDDGGSVATEGSASAATEATSTTSATGTTASPTSATAGTSASGSSASATDVTATDSMSSTSGPTSDASATVSTSGDVTGTVTSATTTGSGGVCPGYMPPAEPCLADAECSNGASCAPPGLPQPCGFCESAQRECDPDAAMDCGAGEVCETYTPQCACDSEPGTRCVRDCRGDPTVCGDEQPCGADGVCEPPRCTQPFVACPASATCDPDDPGADELGCVRRPCVDDGDCDCGSCLAGLCFDGPGSCELPRP
jgi:hypothetical protein